MYAENLVNRLAGLEPIYYGHAHTHVTDGPFSQEDADFFFNSPYLNLGVVVGQFRLVYLFARKKLGPIQLKNHYCISKDKPILVNQDGSVPYSQLDLIFKHFNKISPKSPLYNLEKISPPSAEDIMEAIDFTRQVCSLFTNLDFTVVDLPDPYNN
jgi:hypothetical protein